MKVLALSTSTHRGSAAVLENDQVLGASGYADLGGHAERIFSAISEALDAARLKRSDLGLIVCDIGPGSFTGVRVGVATAKGLALGLGVPLVGVGSLEAMAAAAFATGAARAQDVVVTLIDAKKHEFFLAAYDAMGHTRLAPAHVPVTDALSTVRTELSRNHQETFEFCLVGEAALVDPTLGSLVVRSERFDLPDSVTIGQLGWQRFASSAALPDGARAFDPALIEPSYVRPPDAKPMVQREPTIV